MVSNKHYCDMTIAARHANPLIGLFDSTSRLRGRLKSAFEDASEGLALSDMEMTVLNAVAETDAPPTVPQIGRALGHPRQVIQRAANTLVQTGLIAKVPNPDHKRAVRLVATETGYALKRKANARAADIANAILGSVDAGLVTEVNEKIETLRKQIEAHFRQNPRN